MKNLLVVLIFTFLGSCHAEETDPPQRTKRDIKAEKKPERQISGGGEQRDSRRNGGKVYTPITDEEQAEFDKLYETYLTAQRELNSQYENSKKEQEAEMSRFNLQISNISRSNLKEFQAAVTYHKDKVEAITDKYKKFLIVKLPPNPYNGQARSTEMKADYEKRHPRN